MNETLLRSVDLALRNHLADVAGVVAEKNVTISYGALAKKAGIGSARAVPAYLNRIAQECSDGREPSIDCLVINKKIGKPGGKWSNEGTWRAEIVRCLDDAKSRLNKG